MATKEIESITEAHDEPRVEKTIDETLLNEGDLEIEPEQQNNENPEQSDNTGKTIEPHLVIGPETMAEFFRQMMAHVVQQTTITTMAPYPMNEDHNQTRKKTMEKEWAEQLKDFQRLHPSKFEGKPDPFEADKWIREMNKHLNVLGITGPRKVAIATHQFVGEAQHWWDMVKESPTIDVDTMTWKTFEDKFYEKYFPKALRNQMQNDFVRLSQRNMTVSEYEAKFIELS